MPISKQSAWSKTVFCLYDSLKDRSPPLGLKGMNPMIPLVQENIQTCAQTRLLS